MIKNPPFKVCWNITSKCNLNCDFCFAPKNTKDLTINQIKKTLVKLKSFGVKRITFSGGEPLLHPYLFEIIDYANRLGFKVTLSTNGVLLNRKIIKKIKNKINKISVSLDGPNERILYIMRRRKGLFKKLINILNKLENEKIPVKINTIVTKLNYQKILEIGAIIIKYNNIICWKLFQFIPKYFGKQNKIELEISNKQFHALELCLRKKYPDLNIIFASKDYFARTYFNIYSDGTISTPLQTRDLMLGNILTDNLNKIWSDKIFIKNKHYLIP